MNIMPPSSSGSISNKQPSLRFARSRGHGSYHGKRTFHRISNGSTLKRGCEAHLNKRENDGNTSRDHVILNGSPIKGHYKKSYIM
jgi:hypothetical protein